MKLHFFEWMRSTTSKTPTLLIFLHGMGGTGHIWRPIAASLEEDFLCIAPDQRGHGQSRPVPEGESTAFHAYDYAQDIVELIDTVVTLHSPGKLFLIGHSMGARTALATAVKVLESPFRSLLQGVISVDIGLQNEWGGGIGEPLAQFIRELPESFPSRTEMREHLFSKCPDPAIAQYLSAVAKNTAASGEPETWVFPFDHEALVQTILQANQSPIEEWVRTLTRSHIPLLALRGEKSLVWLKKDYEHSKKELAHPGLVFEEWENCGHGLPFEQRTRFVDRVRTFVMS